ncbi:hypothetical protein QS257_14940 [Terrilactibacillus sp. S3-3]|nr:hypothetical protein QS257_14940 [Terrilactibacillus sp. S3-3]
MKEIKYGDEKIFLSEKHYRKLTSVLPYWGMRLDDHARLAGALHGSVRTLIADDPALIRDIERLLAHTGLRLEAAGTPNVKVGAAPEEDGRKLAILAGHQTYYLKPGHYPSTQDLGRYIYIRGCGFPLPSPTAFASIILINPSQQNGSPIFSCWILWEKVIFPSSPPVCHRPIINF